MRQRTPFSNICYEATRSTERAAVSRWFDSIPASGYYAATQRHETVPALSRWLLIGVAWSTIWRAALVDMTGG